MPSRPVSSSIPLLSKATTPERVPLGNDVEVEPPAVAAAAAKVSPGADRRGPWKWTRPPWHNRKQAVPDTCEPAIAPDAASATMVAAPLGGERSTGGKHQRNPGSWGSSTSSLPMLPPAREPSDVSASRPPPSPLEPLPAASTSKESQQQQQEEAEEGNQVVDAVLYAINLGWPWSQVAALGEKVVSPQLQQQQAEMSEEASRIVDSMLGMIKLGVKLGWPWTPESTSPAAAAPDQEGVMMGASKELPLSLPTVPPDLPREEEGVSDRGPLTRGGRSFSRVKEAIFGTVLGSRLLRTTTTTTAGAPGATTKRSSTAHDAAPLPSVAGAPAAPPRSAAPTLSLPPAAAALRRTDGSSAGPAPAGRAPWRPPGYRWGKSLVSNMSGLPDGESERVTATTDDGGGSSSGRQVAGVGAASAGTGWSPSAAAAADEHGGETEATRGVQGQQEEAQQQQLSSRRISVFRALSTTAGGVATRLPLMKKSRSDDAREQDLPDQAYNRNSVGEWASVEVSPPASTKADAAEGGANGAQGGGGGGGGGVPWWQAGAAVLVGVGAALYRPVNRLPGVLFKDEKEEEQRRRQGEEGQQQGTLSQVDATTSPASFQLARPAEEVASVPPEPPPAETTSSGSRARQGVGGLVDRAATMSRRARLWTLLKRRSRARAEPLLASVDTSIMSLTPSELLSPPVEEQETALSSSSGRGLEESVGGRAGGVAASVGAGKGDATTTSEVSAPQAVGGAGWNLFGFFPKDKFSDYLPAGQSPVVEGEEEEDDEEEEDEEEEEEEEEESVVVSKAVAAAAETVAKLAKASASSSKSGDTEENEPDVAAAAAAAPAWPKSAWLKGLDPRAQVRRCVVRVYFVLVAAPTCRLFPTYARCVLPSLFSK